MIKNKLNIVLCFLIFAASLFIFTRGLGRHGLEFRDDEIFYYQSTQEMIKSHDYLSPTYFGENRFQKPILFYWMVIASYALGGISWFSARFVSAVFGSLTLVVLWIFVKDLFNRRVAFLSVVILMTVPLFFRHAKNVVPDIVLNFFIFMAIYFGYKQIQIYQFPNLCSIPKITDKKKNLMPKIQWYSLCTVIFCSLGFMIKGFVAFFIPLLVLSTYALSLKKMRSLLKGNHLLNIATALAIILPWFLYMIKMHGREYLSYMLVKETEGRIFSDPSCNTFLLWMRMYGQHILYYLKIIFSYFAPWSLFFIGAFPYAMYYVFVKKHDKGVGTGPEEEKPDDTKALLLMLIWVVVTLLFFSSMYFVINHYMLALAVPFAILVSYFLTADLQQQKKMGQLLGGLRKWLLVIIFIFGFTAFSFLFFFLAQRPKIGVPFFSLIFIFVLTLMMRKDNYVRSVSLALFIAFVMSQSTLLSDAKLTSHAVLSHFANLILEEKDKNYLIGVGSHDLHEKEFQVYFDKKVDKVAVSWEWGMQESLTKYFAQDKEIYCLITLTDYDKYLRKFSNSKNIEILAEDYIFRKRMKIDKDFFKALLRFDQKTVYLYFMEKLILVKKEKNDAALEVR